MQFTQYLVFFIAFEEVFCFQVFYAQRIIEDLSLFKARFIRRTVPLSHNFKIRSFKSQILVLF